MLKRAILVSAALACLALALPACGTGSTTGPPVTGYHTGNLAPDFTLFDLNSQQVSLHGLLGRPVVVNFWAAD